MPIANCIEYDPRDPTWCLKCDGFLVYNKSVNRCECEAGSGAACNPGFSCAKDSGICIPINQCLNISNCEECRIYDHSVCYQCANGYFVGPEGKSCITNDTCNSVKKCKECSLTEPSKCEKCMNYLFLSSDEKACECEKGSGKQCPRGTSCSDKTRECVEEYICRKNDENCRFCFFEDHTRCYGCYPGYSLDNGKCIKLDDCFTTSPNCNECDPKQTTQCLKCKNGLTVASDFQTCECTPGSKLGCHIDQVCSQHYHICVEKQACLSFPSIVNGCTHCDQYDPRFCFQCQIGLTLSLDRLQCVQQQACQSIYGCNFCNAIQPNLCFKCDPSLTLSSTGLSCFCGKDGQVCQNGTSCVDGSCQSMVQNKTSSRQLAGIIAAIVILIAIIAGLLVFIFIKQRKPIKSPVQDSIGLTIY